MAGERIMIVEDEFVTLSALKVAVEDMGYNVAGTAKEEGEAVKKAHKLKPDLVLMDIVLQDDTSGIQAAEKIKEELDIPVIYITAHASSDTVDRAKVTEPFGYILKPFTDRELQINISIALYKHEMDIELRQANATIESLAGLLPICATCKKVRDDKGYWSEVETFITDHSDVKFTHGICPVCAKKMLDEGRKLK